MAEHGRFEGRAAIVTGGASGIGEATASRLAQEGAAVAIIDRDRAGADRVVDQIRASGGSALAVETDVSDPTSVDLAIDEVAASIGTPSVVINCAGILHVAPLLETSLDDFDRVLRVNLRSVFIVSTAAARRLVEAGLPGALVNVSSIHAAISEPNASAYTAAKGGIEALTRTMATELAVHGIRVNYVRPGATRTALTEQIYTEEVLAALAQRVPLRIPATPEQVAAGICFLASDEAGYCTGTGIDIDGGYIMDGSLPGTVYR
ncbi:SDR family NAD(P)-dependent oxidoreductase [Naasia aerilata]|uniref:Short-chain dehydrogenase n=1 Tax=Naasia aerilata TaxID=1162966 RepID=A0ABM8GGJ2_9MICO|nr:SDR family NAD(P)-dependent oxidoreductase [Naasia aerilata]BDZ47477.1 short-chain dehydrogenase [Naasia aerilata]